MKKSDEDKMDEILAENAELRTALKNCMELHGYEHAKNVLSRPRPEHLKRLKTKERRAGKIQGLRKAIVHYSRTSTENENCLMIDCPAIKEIEAQAAALEADGKGQR